MASITERRLQREAAMDATGGSSPYQRALAPRTPDAPSERAFGIEITPDDPGKSLPRAFAEDTANIAKGFLPGLAKLGTAVLGIPAIPFGDPLGSVETGKELGLGLLESGRNLAGVTGLPDLLGFKGERERAGAFYNAHPGILVLDLTVIASFGAGTVIKNSLGGVAKGGLRTAVNAGAREGVKESVIRAALYSERGVLTRGIREAVGASTKRVLPSFVSGIKKAASNGDVSQLTIATRQALIKGGVPEASAIKIAEEVASNVSRSIASQAKKLKILKAVENPIGAAFRGVKKPVGSVTRKMLGTPEKTAVGKVYGSVMKADIEAAMTMERWASGVLAQKGVVDTLVNRTKEIMNWKKSRDFAGMSLEEAFVDFKRYVKEDAVRATGDKLSGIETVLVKTLDKNTADSMLANLRNSFDGFVSEVETSFSGRTPQQKAMLVFDKIQKDMIQHSQYDFQKYAPGIRSAFDKKPTLQTIENAIKALSSSRPTLNFGKISNEAAAVYHQLQGTGWRVMKAPKNKNIIQVTDIAGEVIKPVVASAERAGFEAARTGLGKAFDAFGFSAQGVVKGTQEFMFQQAFTENALGRLRAKYGEMLQVNQKVTRTTTEGVKAGKRTISIPVERLYEWLDAHRDEFSKSTKFRKNVVFDIKQGDLVDYGFSQQLAKDIADISAKAQTSIPASVTGAGEVMLNFLRAKNPGFQVFGNHLGIQNLNFENFFKAAQFMRYESPLAIAFQSQMMIETGIQLSMLVKNPKLFPGVGSIINGTGGLLGLGGRITPGKLGTIMTDAKNLFRKAAEKPTDVERVIMRDNGMHAIAKMEDFASTPEFVNLQKSLQASESGALRTVETAADVALSQKMKGFWLNTMKSWYMDRSTILGKEIASKFNMTLEEAFAYSERTVNGVATKIYKNPEAAQAIRDAAENLLTYKEGFQTSPLIRTLNLVWFPMRFQIKSMDLTAKWIGSLSPMNRAMVLSEWSHFASWVGTDEGNEWVETHQNMFYNILAYTTAYEQIGNTIDAVTRGELFGGQTGLVGGVPFGFIFNIAQELALIPQDPKTLDPKTGIPFRTKKTPRNLVSYTSFITAIEELLLTLAPGMPLYTLSGGVFRGKSWSSLLKDFMEQGFGAAGVATGFLPGDDITKGKQQLQRQRENIRLEDTRF